MTTTLEAKVIAILKEAYGDGYDDGVRYGGGGATKRSPKLWPESVTFLRAKDKIIDLIENAPLIPKDPVK